MLQKQYRNDINVKLFMFFILVALGYVTNIKENLSNLFIWFSHLSPIVNLNMILDFFS